MLPGETLRWEESAVATIIFDLNRTLYDPEGDALVPSAREVLDALQGANHELHLVSRKEKGRERILVRFDLEKYFETISLVEEKSVEIFSRIMNSARGVSKAKYVVGDYRHEDVRFGNQAGAYTILLRRGKFANQEVEIPEDIPWATIQELSELPKLICA
jgi:phosphoglycolate phosphatase-like HAD superfamily hydrolase